MIVGIDIGGTKCAVAVLGGDGKVREVTRFPTKGPQETLETLSAAVGDVIDAAPPTIGISVGTLGAHLGLITGAPNLPGWDDVPAVRFFQERFGGEAYLMNDAKACALAEWIHGAGKGYRHLAFLTAGTGMGAGLILDGRLYMGAGNAGEVGHMRLAPDGPEGYGKRGSFEGFCSGGGIGRWAQQWLLDRGLSGGFGCDRVDDVTAADVGAAANQGDPLAQELLASVGSRLGEALALLVDVLNLECIILGSVYVRSRKWLEPAMREALAQNALPGSLAACSIVPSALGEEVGNYAAIAVAQYCSGRYKAAE
jgi:glucokinase